MTTSKVIFEVLLAVFLLISAISFGSGSKTCTEWKGEYRNCLCEIQRRDRERHCQDDKTYFQPEIFHDERICQFKCENGGVFNKKFNKCHCPDGFFGLCCQKGTLLLFSCILHC